MFRAQNTQNLKRAQRTQKCLDTEDTELEKSTEYTEISRTQMCVGEGRERTYGRYPYSDVTHKIIGCAISVHKSLGPGFKESAYENALVIELDKQQLRYEQQKPVEIGYCGRQVGTYRIDLLVEDKVIVELKCAKRVNIEDRKRLLSYLKATNMKVGLMINFAKPVIEISRLVL